MTDTPNLPNHSARGHDPDGPSQLKAKSECPGFENLPGTSAAAEMGTRIHEALEVRDPSALQSSLEMELYEKCVAAEDKLIADYFGTEEYDRHNELYVDIPLNAGIQIGGTGDVLCVSKSGYRGLMLDYKTGRMQVDAARDNLQARAYKNGAFAMCPKMEELRFIFLAPQIEWINWHNFDAASVDFDRQVITQIVARAREVRRKWSLGLVTAADLNPCRQCTWCRHQTYCPALNGVLLDFAKGMPGVDVPEDIDMSDLTDPAQVGKLYGIVKMLAPAMEKIKKVATGLAKEGEIIPDWELRPMGAVSNAVNNGAFVQYAAKHGVPLEELLEMVHIPVAQVRDLVASRAKHGDKGCVSRAFEEEALDTGVIKKGMDRFTLRPTQSDD